MITIVSNTHNSVTINIGNYVYIYKVPKNSGAKLIKPRLGEDELDVCLRVTKAGKKVVWPEKELWTLPKYMSS